MSVIRVQTEANGAVEDVELPEKSGRVIRRYPRRCTRPIASRMRRPGSEAAKIGCRSPLDKSRRIAFDMAPGSSASVPIKRPNDAPFDQLEREAKAREAGGEDARSICGVRRSATTLSATIFQGSRESFFLMDYA